MALHKVSTVNTKGCSLGNFGFLVWKHSSISSFISFCACCCTGPYSNGTFFFTISYSGAAMVTKLDMWFLHYTVVPRKTLTSVVSSQALHLSIFPIASLVGLLLLYKQSNPTIVIWSLQMAPLEFLCLLSSILYIFPMIFVSSILSHVNLEPNL